MRQVGLIDFLKISFLSNILKKSNNFPKTCQSFLNNILMFLNPFWIFLVSSKIILIDIEKSLKPLDFFCFYLYFMIFDESVYEPFRQ